MGRYDGREVEDAGMRVVMLLARLVSHDLANARRGEFVAPTEVRLEAVQNISRGSMSLPQQQTLFEAA